MQAPGNFPGNLIRLARGIRRLTDRSSHDEIVGAALDGFTGRHDPLLIIARHLSRPTDTGSHDQEFTAAGFTDGGGIISRSHNPRNPGILGQARQVKRRFARSPAESHHFQITRH